MSEKRLPGNLGLMDIKMDTGDIDAYSAWIQDCWMGSNGV